MLQIRFSKVWGKILENLSVAAHDASHMTGMSMKHNKHDASKQKAEIVIRIFGVCQGRGRVLRMEEKMCRGERNG